MTNETYLQLEEAVQTSLKTIRFDGSKEDSGRVEQVAQLANLLLAADRDDLEYRDKCERRDLEKEKNETTLKIEREKQRITVGRVIFEMAKAVIPLGITIASYDIWQKRMIKFEETGRFTAAVSREWHLPKIWK